jgi:hypothetical protein
MRRAGRIAAAAMKTYREASANAERQRIEREKRAEQQRLERERDRPLRRVGPIPRPAVLTFVQLYSWTLPPSISCRPLTTRPFVPFCASFALGIFRTK